MLNSFSLLQSEGVANEEYKSSLERDNAELRSTVARQSQRVGQLEKTSPPEEDDTARLQEIIRLQHEKIQYYQQEIEHSKQDMVRLEGLLQKVQEENMRRELYHHTPLVGSSIICIPSFGYVLYMLSILVNHLLLFTLKLSKEFYS